MVHLVGSVMVMMMVMVIVMTREVYNVDKKDDKCSEEWRQKKKSRKELELVEQSKESVKRVKRKVSPREATSNQEKRGPKEKKKLVSLEPWRAWIPPLGGSKRRLSSGGAQGRGKEQPLTPHAWLTLPQPIINTPTLPGCGLSILWNHMLGPGHRVPRVQKLQSVNNANNMNKVQRQGWDASK